MFDTIGLPELLILLLVIVILFGPGRIAKTMGDLGKGIQSFRDGLKPPSESPSESETKSSDGV
jgi:sec-independent protein translocase protein TatA